MHIPGIDHPADRSFLLRPMERVRGEIRVRYLLVMGHMLLNLLWRHAGKDLVEFRVRFLRLPPRRTYRARARSRGGSFAEIP